MLYANGCSFTYGTGLAHKDRAWPFVLAKKLGIKFTFSEINNLTKNKILKIFKNGADFCFESAGETKTIEFGMKIIKNNKLLDYKKWPVENPPRQSLPKIYIVNGAFYITKRNILLQQNSFKGKKCMPFLMKENGRNLIS